MKRIVARVVDAPAFERLIILLILVNAVILGLETSPRLMAGYGDWLLLGNHLILGVFILEAVLKITAVAPRFSRYFGDGWNLFDFFVVVASLIPTAGQFAMIARLARLLRVVRLVSTIPELRLIVSTLVRSIPSMGHVLMLMSIIFYIYAIAGYHLFHAHDPQHWGNLGISLLTLFRVVTLEDWTDVMYTAMQMHPWTWIYFVSFVVMGTFVVINLFIAVVLNNLEQAKAERLQELAAPISRDELLKELQVTRAALERLHGQLRRTDADRDAGG
jgi:voltage-gated sodium channel